jgi:hypothetical protein
MAQVLLIGAGDMGERFAMGLAASGRVRELVLVDVAGSGLREKAAALVSSHDVRVRAVETEPRDQYSFERLLRDLAPDLVIQAAALQSPWALIGRDDPVATTLNRVGLAIRLPFQLPCLLAAMRAVRETGYDGPVANISLPDITHPILARHGLAPTVGLGNVSMLLLRSRAAWRARNGDGPAPLLRVIGHHNHVYGVMQATPPADAGDGPRVYVGEDGERADELAYGGPPMQPGPRYNHVTAAAALPVLLALLPEAEPLRWSTPAPLGLPGGFPVRIEAGTLELDLPPGADLEEAAEYCRRIAHGDGVDHIDGDGTVHFTEAARAMMAPVAPDLTEPLPMNDAEIARRARRIFELRA